MPAPKEITKAFLQEIEWDNKGNVKKELGKFAVQFNPESLKVAFSNQIAGDNNKGGSAIQFASRGTTKLSFELWFDTTVYAGEEPVDDVRKLTTEVVAFMRIKKKTGQGDKAKYTPPGCRFQWGSFLFEGVVESIGENLEYFSNTGKPLRASISVSMTKQDVEIKFPPSNSEVATNQPGPGTKQQQQARDGDSVQDMSAREGQPEKWQQRLKDNPDRDNPEYDDPLRMGQGSSLPSSPA